MDLENNMRIIEDNLPIENFENGSWNWFKLRTEFKIQNLENLFELYVQKIHHGYFSLFLILQTILSIAHLILLLVVNMKSIDIIYPDIICYSVIAVLSIVALFLKEAINKTCYTFPLGVTSLTIIILVVMDHFVPLFHAPDALLRPAYPTHIVIACYVFLPISDNIQALIFGSAVTMCHLITLGFVTYKDTTNHFWFRLGSDAVYMLCVNGMGLYFRFMNEILKRRTFLDRRACVQSTLTLKHEEDQEEQLMLSILPQHIAKRVREDIKQTLQNLETNTIPEFKPFRELYIEPHDNVTILYADIVRYTEMTKKLPVIKLVETLNELFGKFDDASEEHDVLRIKFLGDCYYCVSGIPESDPNHATNCVELGLDMITIIQEVRRKRNLNIDMRIGVHSGSIYGGVIGECKWQYDIWSKDVDIANRMEQRGQPGKVHVTNQTLQLLNGKYSYVRSQASLHDEFLKKNGIETFLISPNQVSINQKHRLFKFSLSEDNSLPQDEPRLSNYSGRISNLSLYNRRVSANVNRNYSQSAARQNSVNAGAMSHRRTAFMSHNINKYQLRWIEIENKLEEAIKGLPLRKFEQWFRSPVVNPFLLTFRNWKLEFPYFILPDPLFKYYLLSTILIVVAILTIQGLTLSQFDLSLWLIFATLGLLVIFLIPFTWLHSALKKMNSSKKWMYHLTIFSGKVSNIISNSATLRILIYFVTSFLLAACTILDMVDCDDFINGDNVDSDDRHTFYCIVPWHITQTCSLAILGSFLFLRIHIGIKLFVTGAITALFAVVILGADYTIKNETWNRELKPQIACIMSITFLTFTLHLIDRQAEYLNRLDYQWKTQLAIEQKEAKTMHSINNLLLQNILPIHVAQHYLDINRPADELYHEQYKSVAVMFASVVDYELDKDDIDTDVSASTIKIMNLVISEFDKLLLEPCGQKIEKIKVVGWTYMAACGLDPGRKDSTTSIHRQPGKNILVQLVRFAVNMMRVLERISGPFSQFKLRIGISHGEVTAGVVGSKKPLYDIWGDAVNMASRMDTSGEKGRIQVTENTALILKKQGIQCTYRGQTKIKSLDSTIPTYFIDLDSNNLALVDNNIVR